MNTPDIVRPETRERVQVAIRDLGYRPHASAARLRTRQSSTIGIRLDPIVDGISGSILDLFLHSLTEQADARGMRIMLFTATDHDDEITQFRRLPRRRRCRRVRAHRYPLRRPADRVPRRGADPVRHLRTALGLDGGRQ